MNDREKTLAEMQESGEVVLSTNPGSSDAVDIPEDAPRNETRTEQAAKLQQVQDRGIIPDNEDG